jgi:TolB-like protein/DNA-binding winged helix-turn-helix (wHTH) protein/Flp pilus assembly protein TadD
MTGLGTPFMASRPLAPADVELDLERYELRRGGRVKKLEKLPMELLILLAQRQGQLVTRSQILERLWGKDVYVDADAAINTAVRKVRRALEDDPDQPQFVETVVGKGYRFVGPIHVTPAADAISPQVDRGAAGDEAADATAPRRVRSWSPAQTLAVGGCALALLVAALLAVLARVRPLGGRAIESVAVLPFENVGGDPAAEYLSDGLTESLINRLTRLPHLRVIARESVFRYKGKRPRLSTVARELRVRAVVSGRVAQRGDGFTIAVALMDADENKQLWGATYSRSSSELVVAHEELAAEVADKLRLELTPAERKLLARRDTADPEAYRLYLRGRYLCNERTEAALRRAIEYFEEAIARDPGYALVYSGLADAHCTMATSYNKRTAPLEALPLAKAAALRAAAIDPELSEAHASLGQILTQLAWDWTGAEKELRRALELNPANGNALHWRSHYFLAVGRFGDSERDSLRALEADPASVMLNIHLGEHYHLARQYDRAVEQQRRALELNPNHPNAHPLLALAYEQKGMYAEAIAELEKAEPFFSGGSRVRGSLGRVYALAGRRADAGSVLQQLIRDRAGPNYIAADDIAAVYIGLGEADHAFEWLRRACEEHATALVNLRVDPAFDRLRTDRRFDDLMRCVGLD